MAKNAGVSGGFVGCIKSLKIFNANASHEYNFSLNESSAHLHKYSDIGNVFFLFTLMMQVKAADPVFVSVCVCCVSGQ